ncbi:MAG: cytochrome c3 family protein [Gallionellaceae bacterium]|nr:cytochrome c3 family protein [Gallionellaceae bacterium]
MPDCLTVRCGRRSILQLALTLMLLFTFARGAEAARDISAQRECANCHVMWLAEFSQKDVATLIDYNPRPAEPSGRQDIVSSERMCFTCHDGFVLDSRFAWINRHNFHPIGVKPSSKVTLPTFEGRRMFPLNDDGKVYCGTCHSAHGVEWGAEKLYKVFLRMKNIESAMCMACHLERGTGPQEGNHPVQVKLKEIPPELVEAGAYFGKTGNTICQSCHRVHGAPEKRLLMVKNSNSELCGTCHHDRYARTPAEAGSKGTHPVNIKPDKVKIPQEIFETNAKLGEGGTVICQTCHTPHFAAAGPKLLITGNPDSGLCKACHADQRKVANSKHNMKLVDETDKNLRGQEVGKTGVCSACHVPHNGQGPKMWARPVTHGDDPVADLCLSCHKEGGLAKDKQVGQHSHPVGRDMSRLEVPVDLPGYTKEGVKSVGDRKGRVTCPSCHDAHQWDSKDPEKTSKPGDPSDGSNKFLRKPYGTDAKLCLTCHKNKLGIINTKHDLAIMAPEERNIKGQSPAETGVCASCHFPHNGKGPRMWAREPLAGVEGASSTCLSCHNPKGVAKNKAIGANNHPLDAPIANIGITAKNGQWSMPPESIAQPGKVLPLYDKNGVPVTDGGNVLCGTCHDPHNWSPLSRGSPSGDPRHEKGTGDTKFLRLPNDNKGTLCANCHIDKGPIALSKHNLAISAPDAKNSKGKTAAETGVCGACHLPHNGSGAKMWARNTGAGQDGIEVLCTECHRDGGLAAKKQTGANSHPLRVDLKNVGGKTTLPLYTAEGKKDPVNGKVACATCHNLHQWDSANPTNKDGAKADAVSDASNKFLRLPAWPTPQLCGNCHQNKQQVKNTEHDMSVTAPDATNIRGQKVQDSGVCGQCHTVHNAAAKQGLWARALGEGQDGAERLCRSCHAAGKVAAAKVPFKATHPASVNVISVIGAHREGGGYYPVFTPDGQRANSGVISCPTCHNPHQWDPLKAEEGPGRNTEGDARNSFLRNISDASLCTNCHGLDALFRYKYFHGETSRKKHMLSR